MCVCVCVFIFPNGVLTRVNSSAMAFTYFNGVSPRLSLEFFMVSRCSRVRAMRGGGGGRQNYNSMIAPALLSSLPDALRYFTLKANTFFTFNCPLKSEL